MGEAIFTVPVSWQSVADFYAYRRGNCREQNKCIRFLSLCKVVRRVRHNVPLSSSNDYVLHHCKAVSAQLPLLSLRFQSGGCDPRQRRAAGWLSSGWSQHHLPAASRVRLHHQQAGWKVETPSGGIFKGLSASFCHSPYNNIPLFVI